MKRQNLRTVSLIVVTFTYLLIGAAIFGYLESEQEVKQREALELIELIVKRKYNISEDDFTVLTTTVIKSVPHKAGIQWRFSGAFYFATTVVTTIGYGHSTPATMAGRSFCMIYALIGIPLGLVMFQSIGERLNTFVGSALKYAKRCVKAKNPEVTQTNLVMVVSVLSTILMTSMAAVFAKYERWEYFDALYYCFITLTTIGFGDYVALQKESALQSKPEYVALSLIFILFGLSVVSSAVNLLVLKFLTLNTEDERRDEQLRYTANLNSIQLEGDVITPACRAANFKSTRRSRPSYSDDGDDDYDDNHIQENTDRSDYRLPSGRRRKLKNHSREDSAKKLSRVSEVPPFVLARDDNSRASRMSHRDPGTYMGDSWPQVTGDEPEGDYFVPEKDHCFHEYCASDNPLERPQTSYSEHTNHLSTLYYQQHNFIGTSRNSELSNSPKTGYACRRFQQSQQIHEVHNNSRNHITSSCSSLHNHDREAIFHNHHHNHHKPTRAASRHRHRRRHRPAPLSLQHQETGCHHLPKNFSCSCHWLTKSPGIEATGVSNQIQPTNATLCLCSRCLLLEAGPEVVKRSEITSHTPTQSSSQQVVNGMISPPNSSNQRKDPLSTSAPSGPSAGSPAETLCSVDSGDPKVDSCRRRSSSRRSSDDRTASSCWRPTPKLICKCCCSHPECIEHALQMSIGTREIKRNESKRDKGTRKQTSEQAPLSTDQKSEIFSIELDTKSSSELPEEAKNFSSP